MRNFLWNLICEAYKPKNEVYVSIMEHHRQEVKTKIALQIIGIMHEPPLGLITARFDFFAASGGGFVP